MENLRAVGNLRLFAKTRSIGKIWSFSFTMIWINREIFEFGTTYILNTQLTVFMLDLSNLRQK